MYTNELVTKSISSYQIPDKYRAEAEKLLLLNNIVNGPNAKDKSKSAYKKTIDTLGKLLK